MMLKRFCSFALLLAVFAVPTEGYCFLKSMPGMFVEPVPQPGDVTAPPAVAPGKKGAPSTKTGKNEPVVLEANEMGYDQENGIVLARGHVEVVQGDNVLVADQVTYFQHSDKVQAEGNVSILQPSGEVIFADSVVLTDAMKKGVIEAFKARLSDNSVFVAQRAEKVNAAVTTMTNAEYTPCNICAGISPFWQLNAGDAKIDKLDERVTYHDASVDLFGYPVFYTPYLSHPTPDAEAKSGIMPGEYSNNGNLGTIVKVPYYWRIDNDKDVVITPWYSTDAGLLLQENYRQVTDHGEYHVQASETNPPKLDDNGNQISGNQYRGAIFATGKENLTDDTLVGFDIQRTTDGTYLRRYNFDDEPSLFSRLFIEKADERNYTSLQGIAIQGLRATDDPKTTPLVLPAFQTYYETLPDDNNVRYHISADAQSLTRDVGIDQRRVSMTVGASHPYVMDEGVILTSTFNLRQDAYQTDDIPLNDGSTEDANTYRTLPQAAFEWRYPLLNQFDKGTMTVEPIVMTVLQANGGNPGTISNEDSKLLELSDTNIFSLDRTPGLDLVDSGSRVAYGARSQYLFADNTSLEGLLGQSYNFFGNTPFPTSTTPGQDFSDYVGRLAYNIAPWTVTYRFALDNSSLNLNRNEFAVAFAKPWLSVSAAYDTIDKNTFIDDSKEGQLNVTLPFTENWSIYGSARRDFDLNQWVTNGAGIVYKNECFNIGLDAERVYAHDRDVQPTSQVLLHVALKNLGVFGGK